MYFNSFTNLHFKFFNLCPLRSILSCLVLTEIQPLYNYQNFPKITNWKNTIVRSIGISKTKKQLNKGWEIYLKLSTNRLFVARWVKLDGHGVQLPKVENGNPRLSSSPCALYLFVWSENGASHPRGGFISNIKQSLISTDKSYNSLIYLRTETIADFQRKSKIEHMIEIHQEKRL